MYTIGNPAHVKPIVNTSPGSLEDVVIKVTAAAILSLILSGSEFSHYTIFNKENPLGLNLNLNVRLALNNRVPNRWSNRVGLVL